MATLEMSTTLKNTLPERLLSPTLSTQTLPLYTNAGLFPLTPLLPYDFVGYINGVTTAPIVAFLNIYKGTVPANFSTLTTYDARSSDIILSYESRLVNDFTESSVFNTNPGVINTEYKSSYLSRSGTATWFRWFSYLNSASPNYPLIHQIIGSVGIPGSGADLVISSTNVTPSGLYKVGRLRLNFSGTFVY